MDIVEVVVDFIATLADLGSPNGATRTLAKVFLPIMALALLIALAHWILG